MPDWIRNDRPNTGKVRPPYGPKKWAHWKHSSGYQVGEVGAGRYVAADPDGNGLMSDAGDFLVWPTPGTAMKDIEQMIEDQKRER